MAGGICGTAVMRVADSLLKAFGGDFVSLVLPATTTASDPAGGLGLVDPGVQEVAIAPVVSRELRTGNVGPRRRVEFTLPASAVERQLPALGMGSADDLFRAVLGINYGNDLFHLESVSPENFADTICFYVVTAVE